MRTSTVFAAAWLSLPTFILACGDDGTTTATASAGGTSTGTDPTVTTTDPQPTDGSASQTGTGESSGGMSASESEGPPTTSTTNGSVTGSTSDTSSGDDTSTSGTGTSGETTEEPPLTCDEPPPGHDGPTDPTCAAEPQIGMFNPVVEWKESSFTVEPTSNNVMMTPIVTSLTDDNGDGNIDDGDVPDIAFVTYGGPGVLRVTSGDGSGHLFSVGVNQVGGQAGVAAGDIDGDGIAELVVVGSSGIVAFEHDGTLKWQGVGDVGSNSYSCPAIADMDGDGSPEIVAGRTIFNADGTVRGTGSFGYGGSYGSTSFPVDLDGNGVQEVVVGDAVYTANGMTVWSNGTGDGYPAVADLDLDGTPEIVVVREGTVSAQSSTNGAVLWTTQLGGSGGGGPPTIADYDGDGAPEVGVAGRDLYVMFDGDGTVVWSNVTQDSSSGFTGSSVYDFEGDGVADVIYADETNLWVYSGVDGTVKLQFEAHNSNTALEYPVVVDVDNDGQVEIVLGHNTTGGWGVETGITVIGDADSSWVPGRLTWNQHAYSITNINDDGSIPADPVENWTVYNNFRSGDLSPADGDASPDLTLEATTCPANCGAGDIVVWVNLGNVGASALTAGATIEVYTVIDNVETLADSAQYVDVLNEGTFTDAIVFTLTNDPAIDSIVARVTTPEVECNLGNNEVSVMGPFCAEVPN